MSKSKGKTIENKETSIKLSEDKNVQYADLIAAVINKPVKESMSLNDMRRDLKILDLAEKAAKGEVEGITLDDAELSYLKEQVKSSQWAVRHLDILDFADYIDTI